MKRLLKQIIEELNIYGGIVLSILIGWLCKFEKFNMDKVTSFLLLTLTIVGLGTIIKSKIFHKKLSPVEKAVLSQPTLKAVDNMVEESKVDEKELKERMKRTERKWKIIMKRIGNFFKWLWGNKVTLTTILINVAVVGFANYLTFAEQLMRFEFVAENSLAFKIAVPVVSGLYTILSTFAIVNKRGCESLKELAEITEQKKAEKLSKLTKEQKAVIKNEIYEIQAKSAKAKEQLASFDKIIANFQVLSKIEHYSVPQEKVIEYQNATNQYGLVQSTYAKLQEELANLKNSLK